jgi:WD40-like Beta Propeller Repeat
MRSGWILALLGLALTTAALPGQGARGGNAGSRFVPPARADEEARLLRFPTIHGDRITFTYAGNLYTVPAAGGTARRLTSHDGFEMFARYSPDGQWLAFTGQYDGNTEV